VNGHDIIVIGASAGGIEPLKLMLRGLREEIEASLFIVLHIPPNGSNLAKILSIGSAIPVSPAEEGLRFEYAHAYVAVPDQHLVIQKDSMRLIRAPRENLSRPAIDPLFRSAAYYYGPRVIGVLLSGSLADGTAGLRAIKKRGGIAIVQDPKEALFPGIPESAINEVHVDHVVRASQITGLLNELVRKPASKESRYPVSPILEKETKIMEDRVTNIMDEQLGKPSQFGCPECGGVLWEINDSGHVRFRCRIGHAYNVPSMIEGQSQQLEEALFAALKTLEESVSLYKRILADAERRNHGLLVERFQEKIDTAEQRAEAIRRVLSASEQEPSVEDETEFEEEAEIHE